MSTIYIDSCVFVIAFEAQGPIINPARRLLETLREKAHAAATSELTLAELLAPTTSDQVMSTDVRRRLYMTIFDDGFIDLIPITRSILLDSATLRESFPQRLPDAIHIATAVSLEHRFFVSFDRDARRTPPGLTWVAPDPSQIDMLLRTLDA